MNSYFALFISIVIAVSFPVIAYAANQDYSYALVIPEMGKNIGAYFCIAVFIISYLLVLLEEHTHMRKSKPVLLGAGIIWLTIGYIAPQYGVSHEHLKFVIEHGLLEYGSLLLFLLAAMTYISAMQQRKVFSTLRAKLVKAGLNFRQLFWVTGLLAFFLSPIADNLTTALVMGAVIMAVGANNPKFVGISCINVVNAANAGGAFSPFGDITTLMVWQAGHIDFFEFFSLFIPSVVCFLIPAFIMSFFVEKQHPWAVKEEVKMRRGAKTIITLGILTISLAVGGEQLLGLPPFIGMMTGLGLLMIASYYIRNVGTKKDKSFDILESVASSEWDTLLFFFGVIFSVGGLAFLGYLELVSSTMYDGFGATNTNIMLGIVSALIDNIPVMFAVLTMEPELSQNQWLLITLTTGIGGSLLSIGSAAGVALMGVARGLYTFSYHLRWAPILALGYAGAIATHLMINGS